MDNQTYRIIQLNRDRVKHADAVIEQAKQEKKYAMRNIAVLSIYDNVLIPYLDQAIKGTHVTKYEVSIDKSSYDITFYVPATVIYTRITAELSDDFKNYKLKLALSYTWCPVKENRPSGAMENTTRYEKLPKPENLIERLGEICWMTQDERTIHNNDNDIEDEPIDFDKKIKEQKALNEAKEKAAAEMKETVLEKIDKSTKVTENTDSQESTKKYDTKIMTAPPSDDIADEEDDEDSIDDMADNIKEVKQFLDDSEKESKAKAEKASTEHSDVETVKKEKPLKKKYKPIPEKYRNPRPFGNI